MSEVINHSKLPWNLHEDNDRVLVSESEPHLSLLGLDADNVAIIFLRGDAKFIHRAVNSHYVLLDALQAAVDADIDSQQWREQALAAISKAKGQTV